MAAPSPIPESLLGGGKLAVCCRCTSSLDGGPEPAGSDRRGHGHRLQRPARPSARISTATSGTDFLHPAGHLRHPQRAGFHRLQQGRRGLRRCLKLTGDDYRITFTDTVGGYNRPVSDGATIPTDYRRRLADRQADLVQRGRRQLSDPADPLRGRQPLASRDHRHLDDRRRRADQQPPAPKAAFSTIGSSATAPSARPPCSARQVRQPAAANTVFSFNASPDTCRSPACRAG